MEHSHNPDKFVLKSLKKQIQFLIKSLEDLMASIKKLVQSDEAFYQKLKRLISIEGIGFLSAVTVVAETNAFQLFKNQKQLISFVGYDVKQDESGTIKKTERISKKGNAHIRRILHMPALNAVKKENVFQQLYQRVFERTKVKMKAYVAVQRKLLCMCYTLWKKQEDFKDDCQRENKKVENSESPLHEIEKV